MHLRATFARLLLVATLVGTSATLASGAWTGAGSAPAPRQTMQSHVQSKPHFFAGYPGYRLLGADGGIFAFGNADFYGSEASSNTAYPAVAINTNSDGAGYWLFDAFGDVYSYGDAQNFPYNG